MQEAAAGPAPAGPSGAAVIVEIDPITVKKSCSVSLCRAARAAASGGILNRK